MSLSSHLQVGGGSPKVQEHLRAHIFKWPSFGKTILAKASLTTKGFSFEWPNLIY